MTTKNIKATQKKQIMEKAVGLQQDIMDSVTGFWLRLCSYLDQLHCDALLHI